MAPLSPAQLAEFDANGALVLRGLLDPAMCADMRAQYWRMLEEEQVILCVHMLHASCVRV